MMELRIDTVKDSREDLLKAIEFLKIIVGGKQGSSITSNASVQASMEGMVMFSDDTNLAGRMSSSKKDSDDELGDSSIQVIPY
jgi:hypothetical protein